MIQDALDFWKSIQGKVRQAVTSMMTKAMQCERYDVTTAPNGTVIGVTKPLGGDEIFLKYSNEVANAVVGDTVLVVWWGSLSNARVWCYGSGLKMDDTSKLPLAGGTVTGNLEVKKNLTVDGALDVVDRRYSKPLSSAGWYRVMQYSATSSEGVTGNPIFTAEFIIDDQTRQSHYVTLFSFYSSAVFDREFTRTTSSSFIDKIRYTISGSNGYVDIHYTGTHSRRVSVSFVVNCNDESYNKLFSVQPLTSVADTPSGETIQTTYTFSTGANTISQKAGNVWLYTDSEGGNIRLNPPSGQTYNGDTVNFWEADAYDGALRFYANRTPSGGSATNAYPLTLTPQGSVMGRVLGLGQAREGIPANADLNDYVEPGVYGVTTDASAASLANCPAAHAGTLRVWQGTGSSSNPGESWYYVVQEYNDFYGDSWRRSGQSGSGTAVTWEAWCASLNSRDRRLGSGTDLDDYKTTGFYGITSGAANAPQNWTWLMVIGAAGGVVQVVFAQAKIMVRAYTGYPLAWTAWKSVSLS